MIILLKRGWHFECPVLNTDEVMGTPTLNNGKMGQNTRNVGFETLAKECYREVTFIGRETKRGGGERRVYDCPSFLPQESLQAAAQGGRPQTELSSSVKLKKQRSEFGGGKGTGILRTGNQSGEMRELQRERERERKLWSLVDGPVKSPPKHQLAHAIEGTYGAQERTFRKEQLE